MAGKKGMVGGGGKRPGAGRKPAQKVVLSIPAPSIAESLTHKDPQTFLMALMNDMQADVKVRADAAKALMPFMHQKMGEGGKKDLKQEAAKKAGAGKFGATAPPRLVSNNR